MVDCIGSSMNRGSTREVPGGVFLDPDDLREPVFLATGQPGCELTVAQVAFFILHDRGVSTVYGLFASRHAVACRGLTVIVLVTTLKAPAFEGRGYSILTIFIV